MYITVPNKTKQNKYFCYLIKSIQLGTNERNVQDQKGRGVRDRHNHGWRKEVLLETQM